MSVMTLEQFGLDKLSDDQRSELASLLLDSIGAGLSLTPEQLAEVRRRDAEMDANPGIALTWEQVKAGLRGGE